MRKILLIVWMLSGSLSSLGQDQWNYISIRSDNDFWLQTDRYYTNGLVISHSSHVYASSPLTRLLLPFFRAEQVENEFGLRIQHIMNVSVDTHNPFKLPYDRPFSAGLTLNQFRTILVPGQNLKLHSEFQLGILGNMALGAEIQSLAHSGNLYEAPEGWSYQIRNDLILNYSIRGQYGLVVSKPFEWLLNAQLNIGTLYSNIESGMGIRTGKMTGLFESLLPGTLIGNESFTFSLSLDATVRYIGYDASLQGGIIQRNKNLHTIPVDQIKRLVFHQSMGMDLQFKRHQLTMQQYYRSREIKTGISHSWISLRYAFWFQ